MTSCPNVHVHMVRIAASSGCGSPLRQSARQTDWAAHAPPALRV